MPVAKFPNWNTGRHLVPERDVINLAEKIMIKGKTQTDRFFGNGAYRLVNRLIQSRIAAQFYCFASSTKKSISFLDSPVANEFFLSVFGLAARDPAPNHCLIRTDFSNS